MSKKMKKTLSKQFGGYSTQGYKKNSPDRNNPFNVIPSGQITMQNVPHPVYGVDNLGNQRLMMPGEEHNFPGHTVYEVPLKDKDMKKLMQKGGAASGHAGKFWDGTKWVSSTDGATYNNGTFYANGGPTFMPGGSSPVYMQGGATVVNPFAMNPGPGYGPGMLEGYANQTMQMGGASQVNPFAMNPGSGYGGGMLEDYADETMKRGGHHSAKKQKKLTPQQMQMMMQAMAAQQGQQQQQGPPGMPPQGQPPMGMPPPQQGGMMPPGQDQGGGMMAKGGIHIKKGNEGKFTAYKQRTGKTTEEALHSPDPHVRQMANFARNAAKWHHEYGGNTMQDGGQTGAIYDKSGQLFAYGGAINPYHPLARFMQDGGNTSGRPNVSPDAPPGAGEDAGFNGDPGGAAGDPANNGPQPGDYDPGADPNNPNNDPNNKPPENGDYSNNSPDNGNQGQGWQQQGRTSWNKFNKFNTGASIALTGIGAAAGIAAAYGDKADQRRNASYQRLLGMSDHIAPVNQPGGHGDWSQYGDFRPDQRTPTRPGTFYPKMKMGGYVQGSEHELSDREIQDLISKGYKIDYI